MREDIAKRIDDLNKDLKVRQESIDILKGRVKNQITSFKETIAKDVVGWVSQNLWALVVGRGGLIYNYYMVTRR